MYQHDDGTIQTSRCAAREYQRHETPLNRFEKHRIGRLCYLYAALGRIKAKTFVMPFGNDMFFPPADCKAEADLIPSSEYRLIDSVWAHFTMFCMNERDKQAIDDNLRDLLADKNKQEPTPWATHPKLNLARGQTLVVRRSFTIAPAPSCRTGSRGIRSCAHPSLCTSRTPKAHASSTWTARTIGASTRRR